MNMENKDVMDLLKGIKSQTKYFSSKNEINGVYLKDNAIYYYGDKVIDTNIIRIKGMHNLENCMSAIAIVKEFGVDNEIIREVISHFKGVEHRLEYVDTVDGRTFYNDTEATNIKCTQIALSSFSEPTLIILGGLERGQVLEDLTPYMKNVKAILSIGQCRERVREYGESLGIKTFCYEYMKDGFNTPSPLYLEPPSRISKASLSPVDAPDGTIALPTMLFSNITSTSTVGFPLESNTSLPITFLIFIYFSSSFNSLTNFLNSAPRTSHSLY